MKYLRLLIIITVFASCSKNIYQISKNTYHKKAKKLGKSLVKIESDTIGNRTSKVIESQNFNLRKPNLVVIHHTAQDSCMQTYKTFALERTQVSSHYVICDDGTITQMLNDLVRGWHAGNGSWGKNTDINSSSIGIELDNNGTEPFSYAQINSLTFLLEKLTKKYKIPAQNIIGHSDIAPGRKTDPSALFPWKSLAESGFGIWYTEEDLKTVTLPVDFNITFALKYIGYNTDNIKNAIYSFKLHFNPKELSHELTEKDKKILFLVMKEI
ncbi:N-acetylmuramoyl-L-alanine amidase [Polaribacter sp. AHE13PA]|uniref:N-acetylmuramoyl-L-alanine amidase n=1 Tax=Polaribacter sp. AHE13PA TaxID=2745562 RepID=UPI001C4EF9D1|nr:N-acetylmuramoyl-L-alanine amidase [Polaribacter sp. AHE13PA]QXP66550.1 N-acetylmuramoyl-L-alanine amidase [Polaribacter sp. AHE13PA]